MSSPRAPGTGAAIDAAVERLRRLHPRRIDLSLGRVQRLLAALGHPERRLPPVVHVAGTNGKGSVLAHLRAMLEASGRAVHVYTSPHLIRLNERMRLAGAEIADDHLAACLDACETANGGQAITEFEVTTAAAFLAFAEVPADVLLLETGLGGRFDATNVVDRPRATAITRISFDHMAYLGETIAKIAFEKAGILKPGVPAVIGPQGYADATQTLAHAADARDVPARIHGRDWAFAPGGDGGSTLTVDVSDPDRTLSLPPSALPGAHQRENAATAARLALALGDLCPADAAIAQGVGSARWPGRLQRLVAGPFAGLAPTWLDGGHNDSAGAALGAWLAEQGGPSDWTLVLAMLDTKDPTAFLAPLAPFAARALCVPVPNSDASIRPAALAGLAGRLGIGDVRAADGLAEAQGALAADPPARLLITGSLYLAGRILQDHA